MEMDMINSFRIRDLDLADTDSLPAFIHFCQEQDVMFFIKDVKGINGFPTCNLLTGHRPALVKVLEEYCGGDKHALADLDDMIEMV
jgi:hypothetical protein